MLAIQLAAKRKQEEAARGAEEQNIFAKRAQELGGDTSALRSAQFERSLRDQNYSNPQQMLGIYGAMNGDSASTVPMAERGSPSARFTPDDDMQRKLSQKYGYRF